MYDQATGKVRSTVHTDEDGRVRQIEGVAPNVRFGREISELTHDDVYSRINPELSRALPNVTYRAFDGIANQVYRTGVDRLPEEYVQFDAPAQATPEDLDLAGALISPPDIRAAFLAQRKLLDDNGLPLANRDFFFKDGPGNSRVTHLYTDENGRVTHIDTWRGTANTMHNELLGLGKNRHPADMCFRVNGGKLIAQTDDYGRVGGYSGVYDDSGTRTERQASRSEDTQQRTGHKFLFKGSGSRPSSGDALGFINVKNVQIEGRGGHRLPTEFGGIGEQLGEAPQNADHNHGFIMPDTSNEHSWRRMELDLGNIFGSSRVLSVRQSGKDTWDDPDSYAESSDDWHTLVSIELDGDPPMILNIIRNFENIPRRPTPTGPPRDI